MGKKTPGQLVRIQNESVEVSEETEGHLAAFFQERNWVAHEMRRLHQHDIYSAKKFGLDGTPTQYRKRRGVYRQ